MGDGGGLPSRSGKRRSRKLVGRAADLAVVVLSVWEPLRIGFGFVEAWWVCYVCDAPLYLDGIWRCVSLLRAGPAKAFRRVGADGELRILELLPLELVAGYHPSHPAYRANRLLVVYFLVRKASRCEKVPLLRPLRPSMVRLCKVSALVLFLAHLVACAFVVLVRSSDEAAHVDFTGTTDLLSRSLGSKYLRAFYWSFVALTGFSNANPHTQFAVWFMLFVFVLGLAIKIAVIGTVSSLISRRERCAQEFHRKLDGMNDCMRSMEIPQDLQNEVRNYYTYLWKSGNGFGKNRLLDDLPACVKKKVDVILNSEIIKKVPLFQQCKDDTEFINEIVKCLKPRVCLPNSFVVRKGEVGTEMFFVSRGELNVVSDDDKVVFTLKDGGFFGEIALLYDTKRTASIVARTYCDMFVLTKEDFKKVMKKFPTQSKGIKEIAKERFQNIVDAERQREREADETSAREGDDGGDAGGPFGGTPAGGAAPDTAPNAQDEGTEPQNGAEGQGGTSAASNGEEDNEK